MASGAMLCMGIKYCAGIPVTSRSHEHSCCTDNRACEKALDEKQRSYRPTRFLGYKLALYQYKIVKVPVEGFLGDLLLGALQVCRSILGYCDHEAHCLRMIRIRENQIPVVDQSRTKPRKPCLASRVWESGPQTSDGCVSREAMVQVLAQWGSGLLMFPRNSKDLAYSSCSSHQFCLELNRLSPGPTAIGLRPPDTNIEL